MLAAPTRFGSRAYIVDSSSGTLGQLDLDDLDASGTTFPLPAIPSLPSGITAIASYR